MGTKDETGSSNVHLDSSNLHLDLVPQELILVTAPKIARGVPLPLDMNLDLYSGFWCTSRCVVFKYSVPPLTDQVLQKVLLTSWKEVNYCCLVSKRFIECLI